MKTQLIILALGLIFVGFLGCYEDSKKNPIILNNSNTTDSIQENVNILLDSLDAMDSVPLTHFQ